MIPIMLGMLYPFYTSQPDFMVTGDGNEWAAMLDDGRLAASSLHRDKFTYQQWQEQLGNPELIDVRDLPPDEMQLHCDEAGCIHRKDEHILALPAIDSAALEDCARGYYRGAFYDQGLRGQNRDRRSPSLAPRCPCDLFPKGRNFTRGLCAGDKGDKAVVTGVEKGSEEK